MKTICFFVAILYVSLIAAEDPLHPSVATPVQTLNETQLLTLVDKLLSVGQLEQARGIYRYFDCKLVDENVITHSNRVIDQLRLNGTKIIATTDCRRTPNKNELVIVYGNYHHAHNNLPYTNKIWRHPLYYKDLTHTSVEYHPAWESIGIIYVLNLEDRHDRHLEILSELCRMQAPLNRVYRYVAKRETITGDKTIDGYAGCTKNHGNIAEHFLQTPHTHALILEDDVTFSCDVDGNLERLKKFFDRKYDYEVCLLNSSKYHTIKEFDDLLLLSYQECTTCSAYLLSKPGAKKALFYFRDGYTKMIEQKNTAYICDRYWAEMQKNNKFFLFKTKMGYQRCNYSTSTGKTECHFD